MGRTLLLALAVALGVAGCGGGDDEPALASETAGTFMKRITADHLDGEWSRTWEELHPAHQQLISQIQFQYCGEQSEPPRERNETVRILGVSSVRRRLPQIPQRRVSAIRVQIREKGRAIDTYTAHAVKVAGDWRWVLSTPFLRALDRRECPDGSPLPD